MELNYTRDGKYRVMAYYKPGDFMIIHNRFNTLEEAEFRIKCFKNDPNPVNREINSDWEFWIGVKE